MIDLLRLGTFAVFLVIGVAIAFGRGALQRRAVTALIGYVIAMHLLILVARTDDWPFTTYPLIQKTSHGDAEYRKVVFVGVDAAGAEWPVDPDAWSPVSPPVLMQWAVAVLPRLIPSDRDVAGRFLLSRAEQRRQAALGGEPPPKQRILGPIAAPDWWMYARPQSVSKAPFVALRIYEETFTPRGKLAGAPSYRRLLMESRG